MTDQELERKAREMIKKSYFDKSMQLIRIPIQKPINVVVTDAIQIENSFWVVNFHRDEKEPDGWAYISIDK